MAIAALVCSIFGLFVWGVPGVVGLILGIISRRHINRSEGRETGGGMALAGIIIGAIAIVVWIGITVLIIVVASNSSSTNYNYNYSSLAHLGALAGIAR